MFEKKVIWITGATSGIGEALVKLLAKRGARIVLSGRKPEELARVQKESGLNDSGSMILAFDLCDTAKAEEWADTIVQRFGRIDMLINNGGYSQRAAAMETDMATTRNLMEVNFFSAVALTRAVTPVMIKQGQGHIVVVSSIAGKFGFFLRSSYSAAKHALHGYFESYRLETERSGIKTLIVCPGKISTAISVKAAGPGGRAHNKMDESHVNAMSAEACALKMLEGIEKNKEEMLIGGKEIRAVWLKRHFPKLFSRIIRKQKPL